jgi:Lhr-like helicase
VLDELHALVTSKRGDLLSLGLARLWRLAPDMRGIGLSATVAEPESLARFWCRSATGKSNPPTSSWLAVRRRPCRDARHQERPALGRPQRAPCARRNVRSDQAQQDHAVFVNTRSQAEMLFQDFWRMNDDGLAIALHHGSLDVAQRRKVEDAMAAGKLRGVVCTSSLDLGVDWGDIDLVINVGAPKGSSRLMQRIGRANHRIDEPRARCCSRQPLRGAGMRGRDRRDRGECAGHAAAFAPAASKCAGAACARLRLRRAVSSRRTLTRGATPRLTRLRADFDDVVDSSPPAATR